MVIPSSTLVQKSRGGRRTSSALGCLLLALAALLGYQGVAAADHPDESPAGAVLGEKPPELDGIAVQLQDTQGTQVVVENDTEETLEVYDARGEPFLRIGPEGVEANRSAVAFYETYGPQGIPIPEEAREATDDAASSPDWTQVSEERSWGWFDNRLEVEDGDVPEEISHGGEAAEFGEWEMPVSLGDTETSLEGSYLYEPEPEGTHVASLTSEQELSEVEAQLSQGYGGATALLLRNEGEDPVTVLDDSGEPAIEIGPDEVRVNTNSPVGREADQGTGTTSLESGSPDEDDDGADEPAEPEWKTVAGGSSFTWQDPRLQPPDGQSQAPASGVDGRQEVAQWEIPLETSEERASIEGVIEWRPLEVESTTGSEEHDHDHSDHDHSDHDHSDHDHSEEGTSQVEEEASADSSAVSGVSAATIVPAAGLLIATAAGGTLLYRRWQASR